MLFKRSGTRLGVFAALLSLGLTAQNTGSSESLGRGCATHVPDQAWNNWFNQKVKEFEQRNANGQAKSVATFVIPVVVHVIHGGQNVNSFPNVSQAQIVSQINVLNADYAGTGFGVSSLPAVFASQVANTNVSFCLAQLDNDGNCMGELGIDRVDYRTITGATNPGGINSVNSLMAMFDNIIKPATIWDPTRYLNIWVSDVGAAAQVLGYATFPAGSGLSGLSGSGSATNDGVWVWTRSFGSTGSVQAPYNRGRTATHEIGHWLGLRHTWGDANCGTDFCNDTPPSQTSNFGCQNHPYNTGVCSGNTTGEMFQNFMDYSDDACLSLFTPNQNARIQTAMTNGTFRNQLTASAATLCNMAPAAPDALYSLSSNSVCVDSIISSANLSTGGPCPTYAWAVSPNTDFSFVPVNGANSPNPGFKFTAPGFYTITLVATNSVGANTFNDIVNVYDCNDAVGIRENQLSAGLMLVPNPSNGQVSILTSFASQQNISVRIYNALGQQLIYEQHTNVGSARLGLNLGQYPDGIYTISIDNGSEKAVKRLVLNK